MHIFEVQIFLYVQNCMRGSLARARVVYAPVEEIGSENRLLCACGILFFQVIVFSSFVSALGNRKKETNNYGPCFH